MEEVKELPVDNTFLMTLDLNDSTRITYDPSNYTRVEFNGLASQLCNEKIEIFGIAYIQTTDDQLIK